MPCCICANPIMCVPVGKLSSDNSLVRNLHICKLTKIMNHGRMNFICQGCIGALRRCAESLVLMENKKNIYAADRRRNNTLNRCMVCLSGDRVTPHRISEADPKNFVIHSLVGYYPKFEQQIYFCKGCVNLIEQLSYIVEAFFHTEATIEHINN